MQVGAAVLLQVPAQGLRTRMAVIAITNARQLLACAVASASAGVVTGEVWEWAGDGECGTLRTRLRMRATWQRVRRRAAYEKEMRGGGASTNMGCECQRVRAATAYVWVCGHTMAASAAAGRLGGERRAAASTGVGQQRARV